MKRWTGIDQVMLQSKWWNKQSNRNIDKSVILV
jgi:hypothetical protein